MGKRHRFRIVDFPYIVEGLTREAEQHARDAVEKEDPWWPQIASTLPDAAMWWVTEPMAKLAHAYAPEIPDWDLAAVRPALTGVILWEGSSGFDWSIRVNDRTHRGTIIGAWWGVWDDTPQVIPLAHAHEIPHQVPGTYVGFGPNIATLDELPGFSRMLGATMILAQTETVATRYHRDPGYRMPRRPTMPVQITQVVLRERVRAAHSIDTDDTEERGDRKWQLRNRHLVRGHWRNQPHGPNRELRKPTFVPPYIKGPEDGELRLTDRVHIWKR